jgi:hypothetical protein
MRRLVPLTLVIAACADPGAPAPAADDRRPSFASGNAAACVLNTKLAPENEPVPSTSEATGHAQVKVRNDGTIEWKVFILNKAEERFFAGHIHRGPRGVNGPIVQPTSTFIPPTSDKTIKTSDENAVPVAGLAADLCANPANYYINYHTVDNPVGATRGQLGD